MTDHQPLVKKFNQGIEAAKSCVNHDLLVPVFIIAQQSNITLTLKWVPSHLDKYNLPSNVLMQDFIGNDFARLATFSIISA